MNKRLVAWRLPAETERQLQQLMALEGQDNKSALLAAAVEERWQRQHQRRHYELAQAGGVCDWCGWNAAGEETAQ